MFDSLQILETFFKNMTDNSVIQKHIASTAFVLLMIVIVLPVWWKTTEVYRASLPYSDIDSLHGVSVTQKADILLITTEEEDGRVRGPAFQNVLSKSVMFDVSLTARTTRDHEADIVENAVTLAEIDEKVGSQLMQGYPGSLAFLEVPSTLFSETPHVMLGNYRTVYYSTFVPTEDLAAVAVDTVLGEHKMLALVRKLSSSSHNRPAPSDSATKRTIGHLDIFLSLLIPQPEFVMASWDIQTATEQYMEPFLSSLPINFSVKSQVVYLTPLDIQEGGELTKDKLGLAVNSVESVLASQSSTNPALNMIVYIPPVESSPMNIKDSPDNSFLIPRWGGVHIHNYVSQDDQNKKFPLNLQVDMKKVCGVWLGQLRTLLGVEDVKEYETLDLPSTGIRQWEQDFQLRFRSLENILDSKSTLSSLAHLLSQIPNIVISDEIGARVHTAVQKILESSHLLKLGNLMGSYKESREALVLSETAFFDKSLLKLLYFPDDQKYAIYIPYFLPVGVPVILSMKSLVKFFKDSKKSKID